MSKLKPQRPNRGLLALTALIAFMIIASALVFYKSTNDPARIEVLAEASRASEGKATSAPIEKAAKDATQKSQLTLSTPSEHDQLVISTALEGTSIDGALKAGSDGNLVLDIGVRDFFDYFLSIADDVGAELAIGEIQRYAQTYLPDPARSQALELLGSYLSYKQAEYQLQQTPITQATLHDGDALALLRQSFDQLKQERQTLFSLEQDNALFGLEDNYANYTLSSLELMADESTSDEEKRQQLATLESQLPAELSSSLAQTRQNRTRQITIEESVNSAEDHTQVYERLTALGVEKPQIDSVIERRQHQRQFDTAYQRYKKAQQSLSKENEPGSALYLVNLEALQTRHFVNPEDRTQAKLRDLGHD